MFDFFEWDFSGWAWVPFAIALVATVYAIFVVVALFLVFTGFGGYFSKKDVRTFAAVLLGVFIVANALPLIVSYNTDHARSVTASELAQELGITPNQAYPLVLPDGVDPKGDGTGYFRSENSLGGVPIGDLELVFQKNGVLTPIDVPRYGLSYEETQDELTTITFSLDDEIVDEDMAYYKVEYSWWCKPYALNLWLQCDRQVVSKEMVIGDNARLAGLGQVIERYQTGARILLSPDDAESDGE